MAKVLDQTKDKDGVKHTVKEIDTRLVAHELGHAFDDIIDGQGGNALAKVQTTITGFPDRIETIVTVNGVITSMAENKNWGFYGKRWGWQQSYEGTAAEEFADQFIGWTYNQWENAQDGWLRGSFMNNYMPTWLNPLSGGNE